MTVTRQYQPPAGRNRGHHRSDKAAAGSVDKQIGFPAAVQVPVPIHGVPENTLRLKQIVRSRNLCDITVHHLIQKSVVAETAVQIASLVSGHMEGHGSLRRVVKQETGQLFFVPHKFSFLTVPG